MASKYDVTIVGSGIIGIAHAYECLKRGLKVALFEKDARPRGASVQNFGQIVPSGFASKWQVYGRLSLDTYKYIQEKSDISVREGGSIYLASNTEELSLLEELHEINKANDYRSELWTKQQCLIKYSGLKEEYVFGGLFFPEEITIDPTTAAWRIINYLIEQFDLSYYPGHLIVECSKNNHEVSLKTSSGKHFSSAKAFICNGTDYNTLFPEHFKKAKIKLVKLQMLSTFPQASQKLPGSILTGQTIRRYESFHDCPSFASIKKVEAADSFFKKFGIHILFKQSADGRVILGDSHEYFDISNNEKGDFYTNSLINEFMISEAQKIFDLQDWRIEKTWIGYYSQCADSDLYENTIEDDIHVVTAIGGKGMTASFGFAKESVDKIFTHKKT